MAAEATIQKLSIEDKTNTRQHPTKISRQQHKTHSLNREMNIFSWLYLRCCMHSFIHHTERERDRETIICTWTMCHCVSALLVMVYQNVCFICLISRGISLANQDYCWTVPRKMKCKQQNRTPEGGGGRRMEGGRGKKRIKKINHVAFKQSIIATASFYGRNFFFLYRSDKIWRSLCNSRNHICTNKQIKLNYYHIVNMTIIGNKNFFAVDFY